jgi:hypothetical protein
VSVAETAKDRRHPVMVGLKFIGGAAFVGALIQLIVEGSKPAPPTIRGLAALGFFASDAIDTVDAWRKRRATKRTRDGKIAFAFPLGFLLAFDRATPNYHHARPGWLTAFSIVILACFVTFVADSVYRVRRAEDERQRALVNSSMAFAFLSTIGVVIVFALLQSTGVGPTLRPSYVLVTAALSWFAALYALRRRM